MQEPVDKALNSFYRTEVSVPEYFSATVMHKLKTAEFLHRFSTKLAFSTAALIVLIGCILYIYYPVYDDEQQETVISFYSPLSEKVEIIGDFTDWKAEPMTFENGKWSFKARVKTEMLYKYSFIADGEVIDNPDSFQYPGYFGSNRSVLMVFNKDEPLDDLN